MENTNPSVQIGDITLGADGIPVVIIIISFIIGLILILIATGINIKSIIETDKVNRKFAGATGTIFIAMSLWLFFNNVENNASKLAKLSLHEKDENYAKDSKNMSTSSDNKVVVEPPEKIPINQKQPNSVSSVPEKNTFEKPTLIENSESPITLIRQEKNMSGTLLDKPTSVNEDLKNYEEQLGTDDKESHKNLLLSDLPNKEKLAKSTNNSTHIAKNKQENILQQANPLPWDNKVPPKEMPSTVCLQIFASADKAKVESIKLMWISRKYQVNVKFNAEKKLYTVCIGYFDNDTEAKQHFSLLKENYPKDAILQSIGKPIIAKP